MKLVKRVFSAVALSALIVAGLGFGGGVASASGCGAHACSHSATN